MINKPYKFERNNRDKVLRFIDRILTSFLIFNFFGLSFSILILVVK